MGKVSVANLKKTLYYLKRNGLRNTWYAARERLEKKEKYTYEALSQEVLDAQRAQAKLLLSETGISFSIVVPTYCTAEAYLKELIESVRNQTYACWELILADATPDDSVKQIVEEIKENLGDSQYRIRYQKLSGNGGISENTNEALGFATKEYVGLLDHDDILTPDALYEMARAICDGRKKGIDYGFLYSDEDKCDGEGRVFFEPNYKEDFNFDLLLSNNYICHFLVMKRELMETLGFRKKYDGAQDYDLVLRAVSALGIPMDLTKEALVCHIPKVLYHWRCHLASTAANPMSKVYAYRAGAGALEDFLHANGMDGRVRELKHVGFYEAVFDAESIFEKRRDLGAVGGPVYQKNKIIGGRMDAEGRVYYQNLPGQYSGYLNRAVLTQNAKALDLRNICVRRELWELFEQMVGVAYVPEKDSLRFDASTLPDGFPVVEKSLALGEAIRESGYRLLWRREHE